MTVRSVSVETASKFESNFIEAELAVSMLEDFPALIWGNGSSQVFTERAEPEFGVQEAAEVPSENNSAGHFELRISEAVNSNPSCSAEEDDDRSPKTLMRKALHKRDSRTKPADYI